MALLPKVKLKTVVSFPAAVFGGAGIAVRKDGGNFTFDLAFDDFAPPVLAVPDTAHQNALLWNNLTGAYILAPISLFAGGGGGSTPSDALPLMNGVAAAGVSVFYTRGDHVHPTDTTRASVTYVDAQDALKAPIASPIFTGDPRAPTAAPGDNDTSIANTAFVTAAVTAAGGVVPSNTNPLGNGVAAPGVSALYSRGDHIHPTDTTLQPLDGDLTAIAALSATGIARRTAANTWTVGTLVSNGELAAMNAWTFKGNASAGSAGPTDVDIGALTLKAVPLATDELLVRDNAAGGAWKRSPVSGVVGSSGVGSYNTRTGAVVALGDDVPLRSYLAGLGIFVAGSSINFTVNPGVATDSANAILMTLATAFIKTTANWALGGGTVGALDTGAAITTNEWLTVYLIRRPDTGVVDLCLSRSAVAPTFGGNIPAAYSQYRRIGALKTATGSATWLQDNRQGDKVIWPNIVTEYSNTVPPSGALTAVTMGNIPPGVSSLVHLRGIYNASASGSPFIIAAGDEATNVDGSASNRNRTGQTAVANLAVGWQVDVQSNASAQIKIQVSANVTLLDFNVWGYTDRRGRDA